jgi:hypothetical protein
LERQGFPSGAPAAAFYDRRERQFSFFGEGRLRTIAHEAVHALQARHLVGREGRAATTFDTLPDATAVQCQALASDLLKKATTAVVSSLVKN